jgi:hypothetical protein
VKALVAILLIWSACSGLIAGESGLTQVFQPLDGLGSDAIQIAPVMCHDWYAHAGWFSAIGLITAPNIPPTNAPKAVDDINLASVFGLKLQYTEDAPAHGTVTLDCTSLQKPQRVSCTEQQAVRATLECLRRVAGDHIRSVRVEYRLKSSGQEELRQIIEAFIKHPKDQPFPWQ